MDFFDFFKIYFAVKASADVVFMVCAVVVHVYMQHDRRKKYTELYMRRQLRLLMY